MPSEWFIVKPDRELGPYTSTQIKQLAASHQLKPDDLVRRSDKPSPVHAGKIQGLFPASQPKTTPPPLPSEGDRTSKPTTAAESPARPNAKATPPPLPSVSTAKEIADKPVSSPTPQGRTVRDTVLQTVSELKETTKAAGHLAAAEARKAKLTNLTLPAAYRALGHDIFAAGRFRDEFCDIYAEIERVQAEIARLNTSQVRKPEGTIGEMANRFGGVIKDAAQAKALGLKLDSWMRRLGKAGYSRFNERSGRESLVQAIRECLKNIGRADPEICQQSSASQGRWLTPKRVLLCAIGTILLISVSFARNWATRSTQDLIASRDASDPTPASPTPSPFPLQSNRESSVVGHETPAPRIIRNPDQTSESETHETRKLPADHHSEPGEVAKSGGSRGSGQDTRSLPGGPPYVLPAEGCPRVVNHRQNLQVVSRGRLWEQRLEYGGLSFTPDGKILAAGGTLRQGFVSWRGAVLLVDANTGKTITAMQALHDHQINSIGFSPDGTIMATGSGGVAKAWAIDPPGERGKFEFSHPSVAKMSGIYHEVSSLVFSKDGKRLIAVGGLDSAPPIVGTLTAWAYPGGTPAYSIHPGYRLESVSLSADGDTLVTGSATGRVDLWNCSTGRKLSSFNLAPGRTFVRFCPGGENVVVGVQTSSAFADHRTPYKLSLVDRRNGTTIWSKEGTTPSLSCLDISPNGRLIICGGSRIDLWDLDKGELVSFIDEFRSQISHLTYSPDGRRFAASVPSGDNAGTVWVWDVDWKE